MTEPTTLIKAALEDGGGKSCVTCSFQAEDMVVVYLVRQFEPEIAVLFLDTGYHFRETYEYRDRMAAEWRLNLINLKAPATVEQQEAAHGQLFRSAPDQCCRLRKVEPLVTGLAAFEVWFAGLRREQSPTRANLQHSEIHALPSGKELRKISPLADWTWKDVQSYMTVHEIPHLPLYDRGYTSIGCEPCTALPSDPDNPRSGRWSGVKLECGIHTFSRR
jgi:phosphoadenosine phosphosulfate reductase